MAIHVPRLFTDHHLGIGNNVILSGKTAHHIQHVLREKLGNPLILFDGLGGEYTCTIISIGRREVEVNINGHDPANRESVLNITLGIAILKREAMNTAVRQATELGVTSIIPVETDNTSVTRVQFGKRRENWLRVIQSACEQSGRTMLPTLHEVVDFDQWIELAKGDLKLLASPLAGTGIKCIVSVPKSISLLIGPEGGISGSEEQRALDAGFVPVSLGSRILRAETAPIALLSLMQYRWGDF